MCRKKSVRVKGCLIGGGFGGKEDIAGQIHVALLATVTNRPVKMLYTRQESLLFHPKRHATIIRIKTGATRDGKLTAVEAELYGDGGAYASLSDKVMTRATTHATGPYNVPNAKIDCFAMYTNNPPSGAFRGFGVTQSAFAVEQNMDMVAEELGMDPVEFRRINAQKVGVTTATGQLLRESVGLLDTLDLCEKDMHGNLNGNFRWAWREGDLAYGWGVASAYKNTGLGGGAPDRADAEVEAFEDGTVEVRTSSADMGQGLVSVLAQCAAEELGLPYGQVRVLLSDTDLTPNGGPTTASRQTYMSGNAVRIAASNLRQMLSKVVAEELDCPPERLRFEEGLVRQDGSSVAFGEAIKQAHKQGLDTKILQAYYGPKTQPLGTGGDMHFAFSYATQIALVSVDTTTGEIKVHKIISAADVGTRDQPVADARADRGRDRHGAGQLPDRSLHRRGWRAVVDATGALQDAEHQTRAGDYQPFGRAQDGGWSLRREGRRRTAVDQHVARHRQRDLQRGRRARLPPAGRSRCALSGDGRR